MTRPRRPMSRPMSSGLVRTSSITSPRRSSTSTSTGVGRLLGDVDRGTRSTTARFSPATSSTRLPSAADLVVVVRRRRRRFVVLVAHSCSIGVASRRGYPAARLSGPRRRARFGRCRPRACRRQAPRRRPVSGACRAFFESFGAVRFGPAGVVPTARRAGAAVGLVPLPHAVLGEELLHLVGGLGTLAQPRVAPSRRRSGRTTAPGGRGTGR